MRGRTAALTALTTLAGALVAVGPPAEAETAVGEATIATTTSDLGQEEFLGHPIEGRVLSQEQSQGYDAEGRPQAYWVTAGNAATPGMFQVTDILSREVVFRERLPAGVNSWANTFSEADGTVYFGMTEGDFYSWTPGDDSVAVLPKPPYPGEGIWRLHADADGTIWGGTYPGGILFAYDPQTQEFTSYGQAVPGETYARSIVSDKDGVYVGTQPRGRLTRLDRATGELQPITLPDAYLDQEVVYDMTRAAQYLFIRVQPSNDLLVYNVETGTFDNIVPGISGRVISPLDPTGRYVYFRIAGTGIVQYDITTHTYTSTGWNPNAFPGSFRWVDLQDPNMPGHSLVMTYYYGRIYTWNFETRRGGYIGESDLEGAPNTLTTLAAGPDGKIYAGAFLSPPGMAAFDPADDSTALLPGSGQVEGFGTAGDQLVFGRYPDAQLYAYDTTQPWRMGTNPPNPLVVGDEQDRPVAFETVGDRTAVGSVPKSGRLGGALTWWDMTSGTLEVHRHLVPDQSIVSLVEHDGLLVAGSSVYGGYGIDPVADDAELIVVDPETTDVIHRTVPVPGARSVGALTTDENGLIWAVADGTLLQYDAATGSIVRAARLFPATDTRYGSDRGIVLTDEFAYVVSSGRLWRVDRLTWSTTELAADSITHLASDSDGRLYYTRGARLYRWTPGPGAPPCDTTITGQRTDQVVVDTGVVCADDAELLAPVTVRDGATFRASGGTIVGTMTADGAGSVILDGVDVTGPVRIGGSTGPVAVVRSAISGPLTLTDNTGGVTVGASSVVGRTTCSGNDPAPTAGGLVNTWSGPVTGQCAELG